MERLTLIGILLSPVAVYAQEIPPLYSVAAQANGTLLAGADSGIYRSVDRGETWELIPGSPSGSLVQALRVEPGNENVVYAGTDGDGIFRSVDGGMTWVALSNGNAQWLVKDIEFDPRNTAVVYAASQDGIWQSADAGGSWVRLGFSRMMDMSFDPRDQSTAFAVSLDGYVVRSRDGGQSWGMLSGTVGLPADELCSVKVLSSGRVLVGTEASGVYKSDDGGNTWSLSGTPTPELPSEAGNVLLSADLKYLGEGDSVSAGKPARFRVTITNAGTDASDEVFAHLTWFRSPIIGENIPYSYTARASQGSCTRSLTPEPDCRLGTIPPAGTVTIEFSGSTEAGKLGWYTLRLWVWEGQSSNPGGGPTAESSIGTSVTVGEGGGGAMGWPLLSMLALALWLHRRSGVSQTTRQAKWTQSIQPPLQSQSLQTQARVR